MSDKSSSYLMISGTGPDDAATLLPPPSGWIAIQRGACPVSMLCLFF